MTLFFKLQSGGTPFSWSHPVSPALHCLFNDGLIWSQTSSSKWLRVTPVGCSFSNCVTSKWLQSSSSFNLDVPRCLPYWQHCEHKESELLGLITHQGQCLTFWVCLYDQPWPCAFEKYLLRHRHLLAAQKMIQRKLSAEIEFDKWPNFSSVTKII